METTKLSFDQITIQIYQSREDGIPVILIPGLGFSSEIYFPLLNSNLGEKYRFIAIDLPGNGNSSASSKPAEDYSVPGLISILKRIVSRLFAENGVFIGHSLAGHLLLEGYEDFPWARGFCLVSTPPLTVKEELTSIYTMDKHFYNLLYGLLEPKDLELLASRLTTADNKSLIKETLKSSDYKCRKFFSTWILNGEYINQKEALRYFPATIALLAGEEDSFINLSYYKNLKSDMIWRNKPVLISGAKHVPQLDNSDIFIKTIAEFLFDLCGF